MKPALLAKINSMSLRERAMLFAIAVLLSGFVFNTLLLNPLQVKQHALILKMQQQQRETRALQSTIQSMAQARLTEQSSPLHARLVALRTQVQQNDALLQAGSEKLVLPGKMAGLLQSVLHNKLQLLGLETLPPSLLIEPGKSAAVNLTPQIYKHGVEIKLRGSYIDLLHYLEALEKLPEHLFWGELNLVVEQYPDAVLTLTVYTLSLDKIWLSI